MAFHASTGTYVFTVHDTYATFRQSLMIARGCQTLESLYPDAALSSTVRSTKKVLRI